MTMLPDNPERDPALSKAWREHSAEMPPGHLDAAIRAAARRAVGSVPRDAAAPEATSPQRWWMPLAAAATIGAVALGVLQTMPPDQPVTSPSVSDMPATPAGSPPASSPATSPMSSVSPAPPPAPSALSARDKLAFSDRKDASRADTASAPAPAEAMREPPSAAPSAQRKPSVPTSVVAAAPRTFNEVPAQEPPLANVPMKQAGKVDAQRAAGNAGAPAAAMDAAPQAFPAEGKREGVDPAFAKERGGAVPGVSTPAAPVARSPSKPPSFAAAAPEPARPEPTDEMRQRNEMAQSAPSATGALAKKSASTERDNETRDAPTRNAVVKDSAKVVDVDGRIVRIRKLHDDGKLADAAKELNALRAVLPDADNRLPAELRAWAATVKR